METFDVHTYQLLPDDSEDPYQPYIFNTFPLGFEDAVGSNSSCFFSCGIHPWHSEDADAQMDFLEEIAGHPRILAIGECGIDKLKGADQRIQKKVFERHIQLSEKLKKPLIIHCVKAWESVIQLKKQYRPTQAWIIHGFRGKPEMAHQLSQHGFWFSMGVKFNEKSLLHLPIERMLCETDDNEVPIDQVYQTLADYLSIPIDEFVQTVKNNVERIFPQMLAGTQNRTTIPFATSTGE